MTSVEWRAIKLSNITNAPLLLISFRCTNDGYLLYLSDLATVWSENLTRKQVIRRSLDENTSIDPTESPQQYSKLLEVIDNGLSGKDRSSVRLYRSNSWSDDLTIFVINKLPPPLSALLWPLYLKPLGHGSLREKLVYPILDTVVTYSQQVRQLKDIVEDKDYIISRLLDRLQASGAEITSVFPNTTGLKVSKKADVRSYLAPYVKGLGKFRKDDWSVRPKTIEWEHNTSGNELQQIISAMPERQIDEKLMKESAASNWTAFIKLLDTNEVETINSMRNREYDTSESSITEVSSPVANSSTMLEGNIKRENLESLGEKGRTEKGYEMGSKKLLADKDESCIPPDDHCQGDEDQYRLREYANNRIGTIGGTISRGNKDATPSAAIGETAKKIYESDNALIIANKLSSNDSEGDLMTGKALVRSQDGSEVSRKYDANLMGSKVHSKIGGISKPVALSDTNDKLMDSTENNVSRSEGMRRVGNDSPERQKQRHVLVMPSLSAEEKADQNRERLRQEVKGQHPVPVKKRRKF